MKRLLTIGLTIALMACAKYHQFEGPTRGVLRLPPLVYTQQPFAGELFIAGDLPVELDDPDYAVCLLVFIEDNSAGPSCSSYLPSRYITINFGPFPKEWYLWRKGWLRELHRVGDYEEPVHEVPLDVEDDLSYVTAKVRVELWLAEPNPEDWARSKPFRRLLQINRTLRVDCRDCTAPIY